MTAPECEVVEERPVAASMRTRYPLAYRHGVELFDRLVSAFQVWKPLTEPSREALRMACQRAITAAVRDGVTRIPLPALPQETHPLTRHALVRRGLVSGDGRLTPLAVEVVRLMRDINRPARTVRPNGDLL